MSNAEENYSTWQAPQEDSGTTPIELKDSIWIYGKIFLMFAAEALNWLLHTSNYALVNTVGSDLFVLDILGLPDWSALSNITVGMLINSVLGLAAVSAPIFLFSQLLERHEEIFDDTRAFFSNGLHMIITTMLALLYFFVIFTEFAALYLRILEESAPSPIPGFSENESSFWPMMIMSITLIITNAAMGLATAHILRSSKLVLKGVSK